MSDDDSGLRLVHDAEEQRYEAFDGDALAGFIAYVDEDRGRVLQHTIVGDAFGGRGVGSQLARFALDDVRASSLRVVPQCTFIQAYLEKHPGDADLVAQP